MYSEESMQPDSLHGVGVYNHASKAKEHHHQQTGLIVGIVFAIVASLTILGLGWFLMIRRKRRKNKRIPEFESSIHASSMIAPESSNRSFVDPSVASIHSIATFASISQPSVAPSIHPPPSMIILSLPQPTPGPSTETARGSFDCPSWSRDSRFQEFF